VFQRFCRAAPRGLPRSWDLGAAHSPRQVESLLRDHRRSWVQNYHTTSIVHYYPLLSVIIHHYPLLSIIIIYYHLLSLLISGNLSGGFFGEEHCSLCPVQGSAPEIARYTESHHPHGEVISKSGVKSKFDVTKRGCSTSQNDARISD